MDRFKPPAPLAGLARRLVGVLALMLAAASTTIPAGLSAVSGRPAATQAFAANVVPAPVSATAGTGSGYTLGSSATISTDVSGIGTYLAGVLHASTGFTIPVTAGTTPGSIELLLSGAPSSVGTQGYQLTSNAAGVVIRAQQAAGLFNGVQTLLQLLPAAVESPTVQPGPWTVAAGTITDYPRFAYRGAMLDVARHFFTVAQVEQYIDQISLYKVNYLHLHLSDDQGWRIQINGWSRLTTVGGSTEVGGGPGGYYTQAEYQAIVAYAAAHYITVVPEIDMPGHTNAALASYAKLNCDGKAPPVYTGTNVGFSSLCISLPITYTFITDVVDQLAKITPGQYFDIGGDEANSTKPAAYKTFETKVQQIVAATGKTAIGWEPNLATAPLLSSTVAQFWNTTTSDSALAAAAAKGTKVIMSPANHAYMDMKYNPSTKLGQNWAGYTDVKKAYGWDPGAYLTGVPASATLGVEAPLWSETLITSANIQYMAFPRLPALAELGWSPVSTHVWTAFDARLGAQGPRWKFMGIDYYHSTEVTWPPGS